MQITFDAKNAIKDKVVLIKIGYRFCVIDTEDLELIGKYHWWLNCYHGNYYAVRSEVIDGKTRIIPMHRQIMYCPFNRIVHHINGYGLDNRRENLICMSRLSHDALHQFQSVKANHRKLTGAKK